MLPSKCHNKFSKRSISNGRLKEINLFEGSLRRKTKCRLGTLPFGAIPQQKSIFSSLRNCFGQIKFQIKIHIVFSKFLVNEQLCDAC